MSDPFLQALNAQAGVQAPPPDVPRAVRNNNPGNLRWDGKSQWQGMTGVDSDGFVKFDSPENGQRALSINLANQANLHGINTVRGLISKYAPPGENNTDAYVAHVSQQLGVKPDDTIDPTDPKVNQVLQASITPVEKGGGIPSAPAQAPSNAPDPYLSALDSATQGANAGSNNSPADSHSVPGMVDSNNVGAPRQAQGTWGDTLKSIGHGIAALSPASDAAINGRNYLDAARDDATGFAGGVAQIPATLLHLGADVTGAVGDKKSADTLHRWGDNVGGFFSKYAADPNSTGHQLYKVGGEVAATAPAAELTLASDAARAAQAGKLATGLARYGDMAAQGALAGAGASGGKDMGTAALTGAALAPVVGAAGDIVLPQALKATNAISKKAKALAAKLGGDAGAEAAPAVEQTIRKGSDAAINDPTNANGGIGPDGRLTVNIYGGVPEAPAPAMPKSATADEIRQALGSRGSNSGLEANTQFPPDVADHIDRLRVQGVPLPEAIREAEVTSVGASPTIAAVTRNPEDQAAVWEGAKQPTPEGRALASQIAQNNAAVVNRVQGMVQDLGGVPSQGEAAETAAQSLAKASDAARARVSALYKTARDAEGDQTVSIDSLRELLAKPEYRAPTDAASRELIGGMNTLVKEMSATNGNRFTPDQIESLRQAANGAYDRMGGSVNGKVGEIKSALDDSLNQLETAGPAFKAAREAHKNWAAQYENHKGISDLIQRDAQGNFVNGDNWRKAENFIGSTADKPFIQVVNQLKANGDTASLNRLKAAAIQRAYEKATNNATDKLGNATLNGKMFLAEMNRIGTAKLNALFEPAELAKLSTTARAAIHMNEAVPGSANTSHTASALAKALMMTGEKGSKAKLALKAAAHVGSLATGHVVGNVAVEGVDRGLTALSKRARARNLARALTESMTPETARTNAAARAKKLADAMQRRATTSSVTKRTASVAGALSQDHR